MSCIWYVTVSRSVAQVLELWKIEDLSFIARSNSERSYAFTQPLSYWYN